MTLTAERLRALLDYDPATGIFIWREQRSRYAKGARAGTLNHDGYRRIGIDGKDYTANRLAWLHVHGEWPASAIDHKDGARDNNRIDNLRPATRSQNAANMARRRDNAAGFKGVYFHKVARRWSAMITIDGHNKYLGLFDTPEAAHAAYCAAAKRAFGEFARAS